MVPAAPGRPAFRCPVSAGRPGPQEQNHPPHGPVPCASKRPMRNNGCGGIFEDAGWRATSSGVKLLLNPTSLTLFVLKRS